MSSMSQSIRIELVHKREPELRSWVEITIAPKDNGTGPGFEANIDASTKFRGDLSAPVMQVLSSEVQAGMLMGLKQADSRDWNIQLTELGASSGQDDAILSVPSDGFAVAATLAVAHGSGAENLNTEPHGGYLWSFDSIHVTDVK